MLHKKGGRRLTPEEIKKGCIEIGNGDETQTRICRINEELEQGMTEMEKHEWSVTFYGSARAKEGTPSYDQARELGSRIVKELGYTVTTGGGPGIMEAANRGAKEAGGKSLGLTIQLPHEQTRNAYLTDEIPFYFFFARKVALSFSAEVFVFFPGGYGTMDEFFELITLIQTKKLAPIPVILFGSDYWNPIVSLIKTHLLEKYHTIDEVDLSLFTVTDSHDEAMEIIRNAKAREHNHGD